MKYTRHRHGRNARDFESHSMARGGRDIRRGAAWRFYDRAALWFDPLEPHFRRTARMAALPGKHVRTVDEPAKAAHGKTS